MNEKCLAEVSGYEKRESCGKEPTEMFGNGGLCQEHAEEARQVISALGRTDLARDY